MCIRDSRGSLQHRSAPEVSFRAPQHSRARSPHGTVATHSEWLPAPGRMGTASPASPRRVGAQRSRTVRNLRTDRAHRITTSDHLLAAHNDTSRRGHQPVLRCHYTNTPPGTKGLVTAIIDGGAIGLMASNAVPRTGDGDRYGFRFKGLRLL